MRLYVDEDLASKELVARLTKAGHHLVPTIRGAADREAWVYAQKREAVVLTANVRDFVALATEDKHHGLLLVYREADATKNMRAADIARAVGKVAAAFGDALGGQALALNHHR